MYKTQNFKDRTVVGLHSTSFIKYLVLFVLESSAEAMKKNFRTAYIRRYQNQHQRMIIIAPFKRVKMIVSPIMFSVSSYILYTVHNGILLNKFSVYYK